MNANIPPSITATDGVAPTNIGRTTVNGLDQGQKEPPFLHPQ